MSNDTIPTAQLNPQPITLSATFAAATIGGVISGLAVALFTNDWECTAIGSGFVGALVTAIVVLVAARRVNRVLFFALVAIAIALVAGWQVVAVRAKLPVVAFRGAFGVDVPAGLSIASAERHYAGGPGDRITLMHFAASPAIISGLAASFPPDDDLNEFHASAQSWSQLWTATAGTAGSFNAGWETPPPAMKRPRLRQTQRFTGAGMIEHLTLLWDDETGDAYLVWAEG